MSVPKNIVAPPPATSSEPEEFTTQVLLAKLQEASDKVHEGQHATKVRLDNLVSQVSDLFGANKSKIKDKDDAKTKAKDKDKEVQSSSPATPTSQDSATK